MTHHVLPQQTFLSLDLPLVQGRKAKRFSIVIYKQFKFQHDSPRNGHQAHYFVKVRKASQLECSGQKVWCRPSYSEEMGIEE